MSDTTTLRKKLERIGFDFSVARSQLAIIVAIAFLAVSGLMYEQQKARANWPTTQGYVSAVTSRTDANGETRYVGVISYSVNGGSYSIPSETSTVWKPKTGGSKQVIYDPSNPSKASVKMSTVWKWLFVAAFPITGTLLLVYALLGFALAQR